MQRSNELGRTIVKVAPRPGAVSNTIEPWCASTIAFAIDKPTRYFDDEHAGYFRVLRRRASRFKGRTRSDDERFGCPLEAKLIDRRGRTAKTCVPHDPERLVGHCIVEIKSLGHALPFDRSLWSAGYRPDSVSKFALGVALMNPGLPDNRWHRLRTRLASSLVDGDGWTGESLGLPGGRSAA